MSYKHIIYHLSFLLFFSPIFSKVFKLKKLTSKLETLNGAHRILSLKNDSHFLEQVYGNSYELYYYYMTLYFGPKKTPQTFILNTGADITTSPCSECTSCGKHLNKPYEFNDDSRLIKCYTEECNSVNSHCSNNQCSFSISYSEGSSLAGFFNMQDIYFENINNSPSISNKFFTLPIGCTTKETHLFLTQSADGIIGLNNSGKSFVSLLFRNKVISKEVFSLCFGQNDGYFSIGDIDTKFHKNNISYVPMIWGHTNFYIKLFDMKVGEKKISTKDFQIFIDSGTTISYFPNDIFDNILKSFNSHCETKGYNCGKFSDVEHIGKCGLFKSKKEREEALNKFWPNITLFLEGYDYILTPNDYFFDLNDNEKIGACLGFEGESTSKITLGGTFMHGHDIIFDKDNQMIGFVEADCNRGGVETDKEENMDNDTYIKKVEGQNNKFFFKLNDKVLIGIIVVSSILIVLLISLLIYEIRKKT